MYVIKILAQLVFLWMYLDEKICTPQWAHHTSEKPPFEKNKYPIVLYICQLCSKGYLNNTAHTLFIRDGVPINIWSKQTTGFSSFFHLTLRARRENGLIFQRTEHSLHEMLNLQGNTMGRSVRVKNFYLKVSINIFSRMFACSFTLETKCGTNKFHALKSTAPLEIIIERILRSSSLFPNLRSPSTNIK